MEGTLQLLPVVAFLRRELEIFFWSPQAIHCPVLALRKHCTAGNEMGSQGLMIGGGTADPLSHFIRIGAIVAIFWANVNSSNCNPAPCSFSWATWTLFCAYAYCAGLELFWGASLCLLDNAIPTFVKCFVVFGTRKYVNRCTDSLAFERCGKQNEV